MNLVSNGYLIDENVAKRLKESGISNVQISLDGINPEQHDNFRGKYGSFDKAINAIKCLKKVGIPVMTSLVPNKLNYKDTYNYFKICKELKVISARCMPFLPMGRGDSIGSKLLLNDEENNIFIQQLMSAKNNILGIDID